ncbi:hypothetical protein PAXRUDRAFT_133498 [Paxillus rubicundulus Ve08.2h10]|uniref:Unplaced genomic scaffold scaffold_59, whole genome shotgun sequence n=1 Tax=Paxillus rubicundulus Ve08.2h10 TaxID=930991 RepID=A0A0D0EC56_9AGAM|nr:hypothetical protein PAXRUDRAFT_133498 [Paxillus rubicundulus Ve08.2h10]
MGSDCVPPPYTPSLPSPSYSSDLLPGEQTVDYGRRPSPQHLTGVYRRITDALTLIIRDQRPGNVHPIFDRVVQGDLRLKSTDELTSVTLKLEGLLVVEKLGISITTTLCSVTYTMWSAAQGWPCPQTAMPFTFTMPLTFHDGGRTRNLPPTLQASERHEPHGACSYSLTVELSRPRQFLPSLRRSETVKVPFIYYPRSRPHMPILPGDLPFMTTVKSSPEEWHQIMCTVDVSQASTLDPVQCLLFIPSVQVYALSDTIPFHLQIRGSPASLVPFLERSKAGGVTVRVYLLRQTGVIMHKEDVTWSHVLGEGRMEPSQPLPSTHQTFQLRSLDEGLDSLDWDGVLRCGDSDHTVASFTTSQIYVKDLVVLSITRREGPPLSVNHFHPIRIVTDPWSNEMIYR